MHWCSLANTVFATSLSPRLIFVVLTARFMLCSQLGLCWFISRFMLSHRCGVHSYVYIGSRMSHSQLGLYWLKDVTFTVRFTLAHRCVV